MIMDQRLDFSSPVYFHQEADEKGALAFQDLSTTYDDKVVSVGAIYIKSASFNVLDERIASKRNVSITISEVPTRNGSRSYESFQEFVEWRRQARGEKLKLDPKNQLLASGVFPDQTCVPGFDFCCATRQHGFERREGGVKAAHFVVDVAMTGFWPKEVVSGFMLLQILRTKV